jgi:antitoxin (DNA-binding transcriptional repressor) of toxin-antitoxin stability system
MLVATGATIFRWMKVGTKELKNRLSYYLRKVRAGERVYVADRGRVIAELRPLLPAGDADEESLRELAEQGLLTLGEGKAGDSKPDRVGPGLQEALCERRLF